MLGSHVTKGLEKTSFADLAGSEVVDAVLEVVYLFNAGDFGFV
jgi:hypothetical protein